MYEETCFTNLPFKALIIFISNNVSDSSVVPPPKILLLHQGV